MIPILILAGVVVGRWWTLGLAAIVWPLTLLLTGVDGSMLTLLVGGAVVGAANAAVGVGLRKGLQWAVRSIREPVDV